MGTIVPKDKPSASVELFTCPCGFFCGSPDKGLLETVIEKHQHFCKLRKKPTRVTVDSMFLRVMAS
jgi:hypothetical protein